jgi:hypothetical protein
MTKHHIHKKIPVKPLGHIKKHITTMQKGTKHITTTETCTSVELSIGQHRKCIIPLLTCAHKKPNNTYPGALAGVSKKINEIQKKMGTLPPPLHHGTRARIPEAKLKTQEHPAEKHPFTTAQR